MAETQTTFLVQNITMWTRATDIDWDGDLVLEKEVTRERGDGGHVAGSLRTFAAGARTHTYIIRRRKIRGKKTYV